MKILLINKYHYLKGGAERAYLDMGEILTKAGHEVAYFSMQDHRNQETPWSWYFVSSVDYHGKQSLWKKFCLSIRILWNSEANRKLQELIDEFRPDIAHAHNIYHQISPSIFHILKKNKVPIVLTLHDYKIVSPSYTLFTRGKIWEHTSGIRAILDRVVDDSYTKSFICACEKWLHALLGSYRLVDVLVSPSQFLADECHKLGLRQNIQVIPNPLLHVPKGNEEKIKGKIVFVGRLSLEKGVDVLIRAFTYGLEAKTLHIIGDGPERASLEQLTQVLNLEKRVVFHGALYGDDLDKEVLSAEALVVPSIWYENLPYVVTENQAREVVVIASQSGGIVERIDHGVDGLLFPIGNSRALYQALDQLDALDLKVMRQIAGQSVVDLTPQVFLEKLEALYRDLLKKNTKKQS
ncbi:MAG: glycosyltransferase [Candidatus Moranbacteria bacterium]|nr:glycosyltransferase [Candidatus Moranbacteria bacterium]